MDLKRSSPWHRERLTLNGVPGIRQSFEWVLLASIELRASKKLHKLLEVCHWLCRRHVIRRLLFGTSQSESDDWVAAAKWL